MELRCPGFGMMVALLAALARPAAAQVGHRPESSPYRDIRKGHSVTGTFGQFGGSGGRFEIGPHDGQVYGFRYDVRTGSAVQLGLGFARGDLQRLIVDPFVELVNRVSGPVKQTVAFAEINLQLNLTGGAEALKPGDPVIVVGNPGRNPADHRMKMVNIIRTSDGWKWGGTFN